MEPVAPADIKKYTLQSNECVFSDSGVKIAPKTGKIVFGIKSDSFIKSIKLIMKRIGGNGTFQISYHGIAREFNIQSKISEDIYIDNINSKTIEINRPIYSVGEIVILSIAFTFNNSSKNNWKRTISKIKDHKGLRQVGERLFATAGGFIDATNIASIKTAPSNISRRQGNIIKFLNSCEITNIKLNEQICPPENNTIFLNLVNDRESPSPAIGIDTPLQEEIPQYIVPQMQTDSLERNTSIIYDSFQFNSLDKSKVQANLHVKFINNGVNKFVVLKPGAAAALPISVLERNTKYIIFVEFKRLNGNGKVVVDFISNAYKSSDPKPIIAEAFFKTIAVISSTRENESPIDMHKICIRMTDDSSGEVLISRIRISKIISNEKLVLKEICKKNSELDLSATALSENILEKTKHYSIQTMFQTKQCSAFDGRRIELNICYPEGMVWFNKIKSFYANIFLSNNKIKITDITRITGDEKVAWIDSFNENEDSIPEIILKNLSKIEKIYSPSITNVNFLSEYSSNVKLLGRPLPFVDPKPVEYLANQNYILLFDRNKDVTTELIKSYKNQKIAIVGARGKYPENVIPINEYLPYNELLFACMHSSFIIDIHKNINHISAFVDLFNALGKKVITTNWEGIDNRRGIFVNTDNLLENLTEKINEEIDKQVAPPITPEHYNNRMNEFFKKLHQG
jgi:hypothetical protein